MKIPKHMTRKVLEVSGQPIPFGQNNKTRQKRDQPWVAVSFAQDGPRTVATVPIILANEMNRRGYHWAKRMRLKHEQWTGCRIAFAGQKPPALPLLVTLTRFYAGRGKPWDESALPDGFKAVQDWIADWLIPGLPIGIADGDHRISWLYRQEKSERVGIRVEISPRP